MHRFHILVGTGLVALSTILPAQTGAEPAAIETSDVISAVDQTLAAKQAAAACAEAAAWSKAATDQLVLWQRAGDALNKVSLAVSGASIANDIRAGNSVSAAQNAVTLSVEAKACLLMGAPLCAAYGAGKGVGGLLIDNIPLMLGGDRTLNEMWTDTLAGWVYGSEPTRAQVQQMVTKHRQKLHELKIASTRRVPASCSTTQEMKSAIDEILEKAKTKARLTTASNYSDPGLVSDTERAATKASTATDTVTSSQLQALARSSLMASQRLQAQALEQTSPNEGSSGTLPALKPPSQEPQKQCLEWKQVWNDVAGETGYQMRCARYGN